MKKTKLILLGIIFASLFIVTAKAGPDYVLVANYTEANQDAVGQINVLHPSAGASISAEGQSFTMVAANHKIGSAIFYMQKGAGATGTVRAGLYAHAGGFGVNGVPNGAALAYSDNVNIDNITAGLTLITFNFTGANQVVMTAGTNYFITVERNGVIVGGSVSVGVDTTAPSAPGNGAFYNNAAWSSTAFDTIFYVYYVENTPDVLNVTSDANFNRNFRGWVNTTIEDLDGITDLTTVDLHVNTTGASENFTLRWTQATNTFSELSDPSGIVTIDATNSTRTNLDANTDLISFRFIMTGGTSGLCDVAINATDDTGRFNYTEFPDQYIFNFFGWTDVGFLINSAGEFWGINDIMGNLATLISGLATDFSVGITNFLLMIRQQLLLVYAFFTGFVGIFTRFVSTAIGLWDAVFSVLDGTNTIIDLGIGNVWTFFAFGTWSEAFYLLLIIWWIDQLDPRARQTGRSTWNVILGDVNNAINFTSFFVSISLTVFELVIGKVLTLFDAIMTVVPI